MKKITISILSLLAFSANAELIEIKPLDYLFDQATSSGSYDYHDETGFQLTDDMYGTNIWYEDLGNGNSYEWLAWNNKPVVNIDFVMDDYQIINQIKVGSTQDSLTNVVLPNISIYERNSLSDGWKMVAKEIVQESIDNNITYKSYNFEDLSIGSKFIRVQASFNTDGPWTFIDEVDFLTTQENFESYSLNKNLNAEVPLSSSLVLALFGVIGLARKKSK